MVRRVNYFPVSHKLLFYEIAFLLSTEVRASRGTFNFYQNVNCTSRARTRMPAGHLFTARPLRIAFDRTGLLQFSRLRQREGKGGREREEPERSKYFKNEAGVPRIRSWPHTTEVRRAQRFLRRNHAECISPLCPPFILFHFARVCVYVCVHTCTHTHTRERVEKKSDELFFATTFA